MSNIKLALLASFLRMQVFTCKIKISARVMYEGGDLRFITVQSMD